MALQQVLSMAGNVAPFVAFPTAYGHGRCKSDRIILHASNRMFAVPLTNTPTTTSNAQRPDSPPRHAAKRPTFHASYLAIHPA